MRISDWSSDVCSSDLLAEKVVGAGFNSRRSANIEWTGVDKLTAWRFGMATATAVEIPENLWEGVDRHVRAWQARAVLLPMASRLAATNIAARLGVFSNAALEIGRAHV